MSTELVLLALTAVLAVIAVAAALVAVKASRRSPTPAPEPHPVPRRETGAPVAEAPIARIVDGRVIVAPTTRQIMDVTMSRPLVRVSVLSHGLAYALRPESRDRIMALMRREFRSRRRQRKLAARRAARTAHPIAPMTAARPAITAQSWLGELPDVRALSSPGKATGK